MSLNELKILFSKYGFKPWKRLGQNFLIDPDITDKIISCAQIVPGDTLIEIGAGIGDMALAAAAKAKKVIAVEKDKALCRIMENRLGALDNITLVCDDILCVPIEDIKSANKIKVLGNLPYYITTPIIFHLLKYKNILSSIFITVQKEVAERIVSEPDSGDYGILSCAVQYHAKAELLFNISRDCFYPAPQVDSAFLKLEILKAPSVSVKDESLLFDIIKSGFNQRRKILLNALCGMKNMDRIKIESALKKAKIDCKRRAETLSLKEFARISDELSEL